VKAKVLLLVCVVLVACILFVGAGGSARTTWEYKQAVRTRLTEAELNELGALGWELAVATFDSDNSQTTYIFKRPK
jgi:hypothetical protein